MLSALCRGRGGGRRTPTRLDLSLCVSVSGSVWAGAAARLLHVIDVPTVDTARTEDAVQCRGFCGGPLFLQRARHGSGWDGSGQQQSDTRGRGEESESERRGERKATHMTCRVMGGLIQSDTLTQAIGSPLATVSQPHCALVTAPTHTHTPANTQRAEKIHTVTPLSTGTAQRDSEIGAVRLTGAAGGGSLSPTIPSAVRPSVWPTCSHCSQCSHQHAHDEH